MFTIDVKGAEISCVESGQGEPVVLLHCTGSSGAQWQKLAAGLADGWRVLVPDLHGYGRSAPWPGQGPLTLADEAEIVRALAERCGGPVHLIAHSYGGAVALCFALQHPQMLRSLTLIEPASFHLLRDRGAADRALFRDIYRIADGVWQASMSGDYARGLAAFVDFWSGPGTWAQSKPESQHALARCLSAIALNFWSTITDAMQLEDCEALCAPTLVLSGDRSPAVARRITRALAEAIPGAAHLIIEGAGHMLPLSHRDQVQAALVRHLSAVSGRTEPGRETAPIAVRRLARADLPAIEVHFLALGPADRESRFHTPLGYDGIRGYVRGIDLDRAILVGAVDRASGALLGLAEAHLDDARAPEMAEMSVSVAAGARGQGLGYLLVNTALDEAFARGAEQAEFFFLPGNRPLARLARSLGAYVDQAAGYATIGRRRTLAA